MWQLKVRNQSLSEFDKIQRKLLYSSISDKNKDYRREVSVISSELIVSIIIKVSIFTVENIINILKIFQ